MANRRKGHIPVKELKRSDPLVRLYNSLQDYLQERGRPFAIALGIIAAALVLYLAGYYFLEYRHGRAAEAYAAAFEKYNAQVIDASTAGVPTTGKYYTDPQQKWQEAAAAFEQLANDYSMYEAIGSYYAGVSYLHFDREKGLRLLEKAIAEDEQPTADLARLALAENQAANGELDKATAGYEQLLNSAYVPRPAIQLGLGRLYEKTGDKQKAIEAYFEAAKYERTIAAGSEAERRLSALAPERLAELPAPPTTPQL